MPIHTQEMRQYLEAFDFRGLFTQVLGWNNANLRLGQVEFDGVNFVFRPIAEQGGMLIVQCEASNGEIPTVALRRRIEKHITGLALEHILIFVDSGKQTALWQWVKREPGKSGRLREHTYRKGQSADALLQKLAGIAFKIEELDEEGRVSIAAVVGRVAKNFDVEKATTKRFYDQFKIEHIAFLGFLHGVEDAQGRDWYVSVMLNRLMFLYFIQKKGFLNDDTKYLTNKLQQMRAKGDDLFYGEFLLTLFFQGLACDEHERTPEVNHLLGQIPYLNGGLFLPHSLEEQYGDQIAIPDAAFERLFKFFEGYTWHLDDRPLREGKEINPDVLGYIFEKYINQKQMGAYYTKEDITGYICQNTILPFLLEKARADVGQVIHDIDPYIYEAVSTEEYLPTETEREYAARRYRYEQIHADFADGKISTINDLITYNLAIRAFTEDWLRTLHNPVVLRDFYFECLHKLTVLDPTCGSGAFLFAAMNILEPLYELALDRMAEWAGELKYTDFAKELNKVNQHPNRSYFIFKSIIVNNLYGVDIMEEAVEICKLRLFLKLVAQVEDVSQIEPLPDIDFNIRAGNTLVGYATKEEIENRMFARALLPKVEQVDRDLATFRQQQMELNVESRIFREAKSKIQDTLKEIRDDLDQSLMEDYGQSNLEIFRESHKPFHWCVEFNHVMVNGGFDVIVGNPPYVEYKNIHDYFLQGYKTEKCADLYAYSMERSIKLISQNRRLGMIVPISIISTDKFDILRKLLRQSGNCWISNYAERPSKLFEGVEKRLTIWLTEMTSDIENYIFTSMYRRWFAEERENLFALTAYTDHPQNFRLIPRVIPKIQDELELQITKRLSSNIPLHAYFKKNSPYIVYYTRKLRYFVQFFDFVPRITNSHNMLISPSELKEVYLATDEQRYISIAILNSNLFFWFMTVCSDVRNLNKREIEEFPCALEKLQPKIATDLIRLAKKLNRDFDKNSKIISNDYGKHGILNIQSFQPRLSKPIIDDIDRVLAQHYGFTDEELDFIINYDIKYRMGKDADGDGNDETEE